MKNKNSPVINAADKRKRGKILAKRILAGFVAFLLLAGTFIFSIIESLLY